MVVLSDKLEDLRGFLPSLIAYLTDRSLELNFKKCKILKFRTNGRGRLAKCDRLEINSTEIEFVTDFTYLGVTFQPSGVSFSKHVGRKTRAAQLASLRLKSLQKSSLSTALKLFDLAIAPIASYGIEAIWPFLSLNDLVKLESVKSRFLKKALCLSKYMKSRLAYKLADTEFFVSNLVQKFSLPETSSYIKFMESQSMKASNIAPEFFDTPAMTNQCWKSTFCDNRHIFTRYACHGFHYVLCKVKEYHCEEKKDCICKFCDQTATLYHFLCCEKRTISLSDASKIKIKNVPRPKP